MKLSWLFKAEFLSEIYAIERIIFAKYENQRIQLAMTHMVLCVWHSS